MKNDKLYEPIIAGIAEKMGYQSIKIPSHPLSGYYSVIQQLDQRLQLQINPFQIDMIARKLRLITSDHIQKNATFYKNKLNLMKDLVQSFPEKDPSGREDPAGTFVKYLASFPTPHTTAFELEALAYTLNIRMVILTEEDKWLIFNKSADAIAHVFIVCNAEKNFYFLEDIQNPTAQLTQEEYNKHIHLECEEKTSSFQEGTFNLPIIETLTLAEPVAMTDFTPEHNSSAKELGYTIAPVPRDGLSAYYAVIDQLNRILNLNITGLTLAYVQYVHNHQLNKIAGHLRKLVSDHIIKNSRHYIPDIFKHFSVPMAFLFTKDLAEQKTSAPHHELELNVLANVLNIRIIILEEKTYRILNNRSDTVRTVWISQNQQEYGSLQLINDKSAQFSRQHWLQEIDKIDKIPHYSEKKFAPGTFSLPIQEMLTFEEKSKNISVDSTLYIFLDAKKGFQRVKDDMIRLFKYSPFQNSRVFKEITEAQSKSQLVNIIEKFLACRKLLFPEKNNTLTLKLEMLLASYKPDEKENPILMRENLLTASPAIFPMPIQALGVSPASGNPSPAPLTPKSLSRLPRKKLKSSPLRGGYNLYLMSKFDIDQCKEIKGNAVILTNENTAYFMIEDKIVIKNKKIHTLKSINRQGISSSDSTKPTKYTGSEQVKEKIIKESTLRGGHQTLRGKIGEFKCDFSECNKRFERKFILNRHKKTHNNNKEKFYCDVPGCGKNYPQKASLKTHQKVTHQNERFYCNVTLCYKKFAQSTSLSKHMMKFHKIFDFLPTLPISVPASIASLTSEEIKILSTPAIIPVITQTESPRLIERAPTTAHPGKNSSPPLQSPPHEAKALPITLNDPHSGTGMGTRQFPPYSLQQWQQNLIKVRQLPDGEIMTAAQNCTKVVDKLIEGSYSGVFTQADPAPASGLEYSSDIKIIYLNNKYAALDGSTLTLTEQGINKYMQIPVVKKEDSAPCFNANFEEDKFKGTYIEVKQLKPTMQTLARQYGGWVLAVAALSPLVKLTGKKRTATLSDFKNYGHVCLIQYDGASLIIIDPQLTRQEDINECVESDINNIYRFFDPKSPTKSAEFNNHITLTVVNSSVDMRRKFKTESVSDGDSHPSVHLKQFGSPTLNDEKNRRKHPPRSSLSKHQIQHPA